MESSSSKSIYELDKGSREFIIKGYSLIKIPKTSISDKFQAGGYEWIMNFNLAHKKPNDNSTYVTVFVGLESVDVDGIEAYGEFTLRDQSEKGNHIVGNFFRPFNSKSMKWGYTTSIDRTTLENSGFVKDDCLVASCTMGVVRHHTQKPKSIQIAPLDVGKSLKEFMELEIGTDIAFEVGEETFKAHKLILSAHSPVFRAQFFGLIGNKEMDKVLIKEVEPSVFKVMLLFIYSDELPLSTPTKLVQNLLPVADRFGLDRLKLICESRLCDEVTTSTVATILMLAENYNCAHLKICCLKFLAEPENFRELMKSEGYEYLKESYPSLVLELLQTTELKCAESIQLLSKNKSFTKKIFWDYLLPH